MKNINGKVCYTMTILLTAIGSIVLLGCGDESVSANILVETPEDYRGDRIEVFGEIYDIEAEGKSVIIYLEADGPNLVCEFSINEPPPSQLKGGQWITISGVVDIIGDIPLLRECRVVE